MDGIIEGLVLGCQTYVEQHNLKSYTIKRSKFDNGLIIICAVKGSRFIYEGSFKESLSDENIKEEVKSLIKTLTINFIENNREKAEKFLWRFDESHLMSMVMETK